MQSLQSTEDKFSLDSARNPADDITSGKTLKELLKHNRWRQGPPFLLQPPDRWPVKPAGKPDEDVSELRKSMFCAATSTMFSTSLPDVREELREATARALHGAADQGVHLTVEDDTDLEG